MAEVISASVSGTTLTIIFDEAMNLSNPAGATVYSSSGSTVSITNATGSGSSTWTLTLSSSIATTDFIALQSNGSIGYATNGGTYLSWGTAFIGASGATSIDLSAFDNQLKTLYDNGYYWPASIFTNNGADTINTHSGDDQTYINLSETTAARDIISFDDQWVDENFDLITMSPITIDGFGVNGTSTNDQLSLTAQTIATNTSGYVDGTDVGIVGSHSITSGIAIFKDTSGNIITIDTAEKAKDVYDYLETNVTTAGIVAAAEVNVDGTGLAIYQKGASGVNGLLVVLAGVSGVTLSTTEGTNKVQIVDTTGPEVMNVATTTSGLNLYFGENVSTASFTGVKLYKNGITDMGTLSQSINGSTVTLTSSTSIADTDFVVLDATATHTFQTTDGLGNTWSDTELFKFAKGGAGANTIDLSTLTDVTEAEGGAGNDTITGTSGNDYLVGNEGNDTLNGGSGDDDIEGGAGDDTIAGGTGNDWMSGGTGTDTLSYAAASSAVTINLLNRNASGGDGNDNFVGFENVTGSNYNDTISGDANNNNISAGSGDDTIYGGYGDDSIGAGAGSDYIDGGYGNDTLRYTNVSANGLVVDLNITTAQNTVNSGYDTIIGIENLSGSSFNDIFTGDDNGNILSGGNGDDWFKANGGNDTIYGGAGNDSIGAGLGDDFIDGGDGSDIFRMGSSDVAVTVDLSITTAQNTRGTEYDTIINIENLYGSVYGDTLKGNAGNNYITGQLGDDVINGDNGTDTSTYTYASNEYTIVKNIDGSLTVTDNTSSREGSDTLTNIEYLKFSDTTIDTSTIAYNSNTPPTSANATVTTLEDTAKVFALSDFAFSDVDAGNTLTSVKITTLPTAGTLTFNGTAVSLNQEILASDIDAGLLLFTPAANENGTGYTSFGFEVSDGTDYSTSENIITIDATAVRDDLTLTGTSGNDTLNGDAIDVGSYDTLSGLAGDDILNGLAGNDTLDGGAGIDTMIGGLGNDTYYVDNASDVTTETSTLSTEIDTVITTVTRSLGANFENLTLSGTTAINGIGNVLNNTMIGNSADNALNGGAGIDTMVGGLGNDTYYVDNASDVTTETSTLLTEIDTVVSTLSRTLGSNLENLTLSGTAAIDAIGNTLANRLTGNSADNKLNGGAGIDTMVGGLGNDTYYVDNASDVTTETSTLLSEIDTIITTVSRTLGANFENLTLSGTAAIDGTGNTLNNRLTGNSADNVLNGSTGADTMVGGLGNDTYYVDNASDVTTETSTLLTEIDTVITTVTRSLGAHFENLTLSGTAAIDGIGNSLDNTIIGNSAANKLNGSTGADTMIGGTGWDTYYVDNAGDIVTETSTAGGEIDTVITTINNYTLTSNVNNLMLSGSSALNGYGNELNNRLTGNDENNILDGGTGADIMLGGLGNDTYYVDNASDVTTELSSLSTEIDTVISTVSRTLSGNIENLTLAGNSAIYGIGNTLDNVMIGNSAANTLNGYTGNDTLTGGDGADVFFFNSALNGTTNIDTITDFIAIDDTIRLENAYFTNLTTTGTLSAANFVASADGAAVDANDYILYNTTTGALYYDADGIGGIAAVQFAILGTSAHPSISNADFIVS